MNTTPSSSNLLIQNPNLLLSCSSSGIDEQQQHSYTIVANTNTNPSQILDCSNLQQQFSFDQFIQPPDEMLLQGGGGEQPEIREEILGKAILQD